MSLMSYKPVESACGWTWKVVLLSFDLVNTRRRMQCASVVVIPLCTSSIHLQNEQIPMHMLIDGIKTHSESLGNVKISF